MTSRREVAIALLERADPVDECRIASEAEVLAARERVRHMIAADAPRIARGQAGRRWAKTGGSLTALSPPLLGVAAVGVLIAVLLALGSSSTGPEVPTAAAMTIRRAAEAVQPAPGAILHIDVTTTSSYANGDHWSARQDLWQQQRGAVCNYLNLELGSPGTPVGTEGGMVDGSEQVYDPIRNTIYIAPPVRVAPLPAGKSPGTECSFMAGFAHQVRMLLSSGRARVEGRARIDGKDTIRIVSGANTYYVVAGSYAPAELVYGRLTDSFGMTTMTFHTYQQLPAARASTVLSLKAEHPTARVRESLAAFRAANNRLYRDG